MPPLHLSIVRIMVSEDIPTEDTIGRIAQLRWIGQLPELDDGSLVSFCGMDCCLIGQLRIEQAVWDHHNKAFVYKAEDEDTRFFSNVVRHLVECGFAVSNMVDRDDNPISLETI